MCKSVKISQRPILRDQNTFSHYVHEKVEVSTIHTPCLASPHFITIFSTSSYCYVISRAVLMDFLCLLDMGVALGAWS
jgi:hypothetical protein